MWPCHVAVEIDNCCIHIFNNKREVIKELIGRGCYVKSMIQLADGRLVSLCHHSKIQIWDLEKETYVEWTNGNAIVSLTQGSDGKLVSLHHFGLMCIWDLEKETHKVERLRKFDEHPDCRILDTKYTYLPDFILHDIVFVYPGDALLAWVFYTNEDREKVQKLLDPFLIRDLATIVVKYCM